MDVIVWIGIATAGLLALLAVGYVIWPLLRPGPTLPMVDDDRMADLLIRKDVLLRAIKDLDFDFHMGKMSQEDYARFAARLRRQAMGIIQQIDKIAPESTNHDQELEAEIARLRKVHSAAPSPLGKAQPSSPTQPTANGSTPQFEAPSTQPAPPAPDAVAPTPKVTFCTECGKPVGAQHKFCAECGAPLPAKTL